MSDDYKTTLNPILDEYEGFSETVYNDSKGNPTIGNGFNLNDRNNHGIMALHGVDVNSLHSGGRLSKEQNDAIRDTIIKEKEKLVRNVVGSDFFDSLPTNKKAVVMSLGYNSINLLGPKFRQNMANNDDLLAAKEILLNSNASKDLGTLRRRTQEAKTFLGKDQFEKMGSLLTEDEKSQINNILNSSDNENVKQDYLKQYGTMLQKSNTPKPLDFSNILNFNKKPTQ